MNRVLIGPNNAAGQAAGWAAALRQAGHDAVSLAYRPRPQLPHPRRLPSDAFQAPPDLRLPFPKLTTRRGRRRRARRLAEAFSHIALDGFSPLLGAIRAPLTRDELEQLSDWGVRVALIAHGSDIRDPNKHTSENPDSYFPLLDPDLRSWLVERSACNRALAETAGVPVFVSTPDLLLDLPSARWLPLSVDPALWEAPSRAIPSKPRVLHAPSSGMKGSDVIDPVLHELDRQGRIEYVRPAGVPHSDMPGLVASVDVVVDQTRSGFYSVTTVEAMMAGRVVVGHVSPRVRALLPEDPGIVDAPAPEFGTVIEDLLNARADWPHLADRSHDYGLRWHSGHASAVAFAEYVSSA